MVAASTTTTTKPKNQNTKTNKKKGVVGVSCSPAAETKCPHRYLWTLEEYWQVAKGLFLVVVVVVVVHDFATSSAPTAHSYESRVGCRFVCSLRVCLLDDRVSALAVAPQPSPWKNTAY